MITATELLLLGYIQGHGVRPAIARLAVRHSLAGEVRNTLRGLSVILEGESEAIELCCEELSRQLPEGSTLVGIERQNIASAHRLGFHIRRDTASGPLVTPVSQDLGVCSECLADVNAPLNRRYQYPLTTCAACGPRWSVIRSMPYEREATTLAEFALCAECLREYSLADDRRFHAQTIGCPQCGPNVWGVDESGSNVGKGMDAIRAAVVVLQAGKVIALRGIGGYQLLCDGTSSAAVTRLRSRKGREAKPLAVMVESIKAAERLAFLSAAELSELHSRANPIVLCRAKAGQLTDAVHPGLSDVGLLLPSSPLHALLADMFGEPLVCTSGNREGDPLVSDVDEAERVLRGIADFWLHHNRPIVAAIDDSVVRVIGGRPVTIRLARGLAPLSLPVGFQTSAIALGGHQKAACAWSNGSQAVLGPHIGDLETLPTRDRFLRQLQHAKELYRFANPRSAFKTVPWASSPCRLSLEIPGQRQFGTAKMAVVRGYETGSNDDSELITICDLHPEYFTTHLARQFPNVIQVQHHVAHVAAGMLEHDLLNREVIGVAWDGTGYGSDATLWGGEFLRVTPNFDVERVAHLRPFRLLGGETAIREPWRVALTLLMEAVGPTVDVSRLFPEIKSSEVDNLKTLWGHPRSHSLTTSAGRLFDAAAALVFGLHAASFEGQPAMLLESMADPTTEGEYSVTLTSTTPLQVDWRPLIYGLWEDRLRGTSPASISMKFHRTLAKAIVDVARQFPSFPVVLCGGVFQNRLLTELIIDVGTDLALKLPGRIPPNDGGLAAGQLAVALKRHSATKN